MKRGLYEELKEYAESGFYPFHMPGHKRSPESGPLKELYRIDITEIDGFDNLHQPEGILKEAQERAAKLYHSEETYFLINGSTAGILSAIAAVSDKKKLLIMARNCHKSVYHAAFLNGMETLYLYPELLEEYGISDGIRKEQLKELLLEIADQKGIKKEELRKVVAAVVITSPTYDGICSDVKGITETAHACGIPVIVDQAHGAHFGFHPGFPENAVTLGADIVIHSVHKTLPAPTQTALLHCNGTIVNRELVRKFLGIYQTSSPSYVLMAGIELCMDILEREGRDRLEGLLRLRSRLTEKTGELKHIKIYPSMAEEGTEYNGKDGEFVSGRQEPGRLLCSVRGSNITGREFYHLLREKYHLQMEMYAGDYVIGILSMMDKEEGFERLAQALCETDRLLERNEKLSLHYQQRKPERACLLSDAFTAESEYIPLEEAAKRTAAEFVNLYPPGIPILVPGEKADKEILELIENYLRLGYSLQGIMGKAEDKGYFIRVLKQ